MIEDATRTDNGPAALVPTEMPAMRSDTPDPARRPGPLALLSVVMLIWFLPKRMGPRLAACGWIVTVSAHLVATLVGLSLIAYGYLTTVSVIYGNPMWGPSFRVDMPETGMTAAESIRAPFVALVTMAHGLAAHPTGGRVVLSILVGVPVGLLLLAVLVMPFGAAGEWLGRLFGRCLRLALWSTTLMLPLGIGWLVWPRFLAWAGVDHAPPPSFMFGEPPETDDQAYTWAFTALSIFGIWWLVVLLRSALRYAGPAEGAAWVAQRPRCMKCRYILAGLPLDGLCPECGASIASSLEKQRRALVFTRWRAFVASVKACFSRCQSPAASDND